MGGNSMDHPLIARFQATTELQGDRSTLDAATVRLAGWMDIAADHLSEDDVTVQVAIGALLYRGGLLRRLERPQ